MSYKPTIAVFGTSGALGGPTIDALTSSTWADKVNYPIKAVTRDPSKKTSTDKVQYVEGDLRDDNVASIAKSLSGVDVVIELVGANPASFGVLEKIAAELKPKVYIPSQFGTDVEAADAVLPGFLGLKTEHSKKLRSLGIKVVDVYTSFFAAKGGFLYEVVGHVGVDKDSKTVTYVGSPDNKVAVTNVKDIGLSVASLAVTEPSNLPDTVRVQSEEVTFKEIASKYESSHDVKLTEKHISAEQLLKEGQEVWDKGFDPSKFLYYLFVIAGQGRGKGVLFDSNDNELVNPGEKYWKWTKY